uniref:Uncharacterized protein n=1 Tax=Percolomonas cosmopolitus TaxID=63605 RepID=A0A7S1KUR6_9EUKA
MMHRSSTIFQSLQRCSLPASSSGRRFYASKKRPSTQSRKSTVDALTKYLENEPQHPKLVSNSFPGPKSEEILSKLSGLMDTRHMIASMDVSSSYGNFLADADGNMFLDVNTLTSSLLCGYNNPVLTSLAEKTSQAMKSDYVNRPNLFGSYPTAQSVEYMENVLMRLRPEGMDRLVICRDPIDTAQRMAILRQKRKLHQPTREDLSTYSSSLIETADASDLPVIARFQYKSNPLLTGILPLPQDYRQLFSPHPTIQFPRLRYPLPVFSEKNREEETRCLEETRDLLKKDTRIAAIIIQPVLIDRHASADFYKQLRQITMEEDVLMIVDEQQTAGGLSGSFYAHTQWELPTPPDIVVFNNQLQGSGFFHRDGLRVPHPYRLALTDHVSAWQLSTVLDIIEDNDLLTKVRKAGVKVRDGLYQLEQQYPDLIHQSRGLGAFCAVTCSTDTICNSIIESMQNQGIMVGRAGSASKTILVRPMLIFGDRHADMFLERFGLALEKELANYGD